MEESDLDWLVQHRNRLARARTREHRMRGGSSHTSDCLREAIRATDELIENLQARFGVKVEVVTREVG